ncbi:Golgi apparatus membrane protein TVP23 homolog B [Tetranychus urticae]|uniref:Golgi apparatus membrane protein TVP23 homolog n=1 Tax=Tetranychus urticae TaxID=32264 RepID=T1KZW2_TETUR|nr:Golgi apparatus membrane protein TVP23 homolog B [Tetranychus urticae]
MASTSSSEHLIFDFDRSTSIQPQKRFKHPMAAMFHIAFKGAAILLYLFGGLFGQNFLSTFVALVFLISMDFWTVKNVTGRLLAGLRWWNHVDEEGNNHWVFENKHAKNQVDSGSLNIFDDKDSNTADSQIFWIPLIFTPLIWFLLLLVTIFRFNIQWFVVVALALILSSSNLYGFIRCRLGSKDVKSTLTQFVGKKIFYNFMGSNNSPTVNPTSSTASFVSTT